MRTLLIALALVIPRSILAAVISAPSKAPAVHDQSHEIHDKELPGSWSQEPDHPVHNLFRRASGDGTTYAQVGTPAWSAAYPPMGVPNPNTIPQAWSDALNAAVAAGKIPNIPTATGQDQYPPGVDPNGPLVCSSAVWCQSNDSIWNSPDGVFASSFDDGPYPQTTRLVQFLTTNNLTTTHFMIGSNILANPNPFLDAFNAGHDIAVHTWSHPYMSTLNNINIVGELGWTMQIIHNSTNGRVPRYWRPPYGDADARVRAIAKEVFGLETVVWNSDTMDWTSNNAQQITASLSGILSSRPKSPGLITLEHEISDPMVDGFIAAFPAIAANGWTFRSLAQVVGNGRSYQNANTSTSDVTPKGILRQEVVPTTTSSTTVMPTPSATPSQAASSQRSGSQYNFTISMPRVTLLLFSLFLSTFL